MTIFGCFFMHRDKKANYCKEVENNPSITNCQNSTFTYISIANIGGDAPKYKKQYIIQSWLTLVCVFILVISILTYKRFTAFYFLFYFDFFFKLINLQKNIWIFII